MKYRYTVTCEGSCEAETPAQAEAAALWEVDNGLQALTTVALEPLTKGEGEAA